MKKITTIYLISIFLLAQNITAQWDKKSIKTVVANKTYPLSILPKNLSHRDS